MASLWDSRLSLYSIPAAWLLAYIPQVIKVNLLKQVGGYNNLEPRQNIAKLGSKPGVEDKLKAKIARVEGTHNNGLESFPLFAISVLVANHAGLAQSSINKTAALYLASRVLYSYIYIQQSRQWHSSTRTLVWLVGVGSSISLLIRGANLA
ncbi:hypothetical protein EST38_g3764 [Candolleomyces aberdarensis]|uniref:Uncharacterized protein n=1 Tax=Candolleomyces aberdarensis TaxID=2316362 RepID=A0A4Q2DPS8_9AGAR|nr:hypothetical protein EST38_g3764 [Candolleomyces aberdarensis]